MVILMAILMWLSACFTSSFPSPAHSLQSDKPKATWLWDTALIGTNEGRSDVVQFAKSKQVGRIYLQANPDVAQSAYQSFIRSAGDNGIQVHALGGAPDWALPENRQKMTDFVHWVKTYNASVLDNERFTGIQADIEPYLLPDWTADQNAVAANWRQSISYFHGLVKKDSALTTAAAVPFWLDSIKLPDGSGTLGEAIMSEVDEIALMSYRDQAVDVIALATAEIAAGDRLGKKVWIGVETNPDPDNPHITFHELGNAEMERQLALIHGFLKGRPSYAGIAVHDYTGWRTLRD